MVYRQVNRRLRAAGLHPFRPEVGEFVTSFDMAGVSLSLMLLDDELAELYDAPCDTPAFRRLPQTPAEGDDERGRERASRSRLPPRPDTRLPSGRRRPGGGLPVTLALHAALELVAANEDELGRLDAVAGDGDHGIGIVRGLRAAAGGPQRRAGTGR
ncbi:dihydroxyacetone kinase subunit DhaK [Streptomyces albulus]|nr:dihydroxyacetone kinase subunit DhaK [Streptomyces noursei]